MCTTYSKQDVSNRQPGSEYIHLLNRPIRLSPSTEGVGVSWLE